MAITSETQRRYDPKKGGYAYFTLFRSSEKGERPEWAQDGDILEENCEGGGNYECKRDAKGRIKWEVASDWDRQTGGGSSGGGGGGGGAEKFVVTLTQENDTWTADKSIADIVAADEANKVVVAKFPRDGMYVELQLNSAVEYQGIYGALFIGFANSGNDNKVVCVQCANEGSGDVISVTLQNRPTSSNEPLIVTLTENSGTLTGDKTYQEVKEARMAGRPVDLVLTGYTCASVIDVSDGGSTISVSFIASGQLLTATGAPNDYVSKTL